MSEPKQEAPRAVSAAELADVAGGSLNFTAIKSTLVAVGRGRILDEYCGTVPRRPFPVPPRGPWGVLSR